MMKATWILIFFLVGQLALSDCRPKMCGGLCGRSGCAGKLSLYRGQRLFREIE